MRRLAAASLLIALLGPALPGTAGAQEDGGAAGFLSNLDYCLQGGGIIPVGPQGRSLTRGPHLGASIYGETGLGFLVGGEVGISQSQDVFNTRMVMVGVSMRLSPVPEDYRMHVQIGAGAYHVSYDPDAPLAAPDSRVRPGGSFAVGVHPIKLGEFLLGGMVGYTGVVLAREEALSYMTVAVSLSYRTRPY